MYLKIIISGIRESEQTDLMIKQLTELFSGPNGSLNIFQLLYNIPGSFCTRDLTLNINKIDEKKFLQNIENIFGNLNDDQKNILRFFYTGLPNTFQISNIHINQHNQIYLNRAIENFLKQNNYTLQMANTSAESDRVNFYEAAIPDVINTLTETLLFTTYNSWGEENSSLLRKMYGIYPYTSYRTNSEAHFFLKKGYSIIFSMEDIYKLMEEKMRKNLNSLEKNLIFQICWRLLPSHLNFSYEAIAHFRKTILLHMLSRLESPEIDNLIRNNLP